MYIYSSEAWEKKKNCKCITFLFVLSGNDNRHMKAISDTQVLCSRLWILQCNSEAKETKQGNRRCILNTITLHFALHLTKFFACTKFTFCTECFVNLVSVSLRQYIFVYYRRHFSCSYSFLEAIAIAPFCRKKNVYLFLMLLHIAGMSATLKNSEDNLLHIHGFQFQTLVYVQSWKMFDSFNLIRDSAP